MRLLNRSQNAAVAKTNQNTKKQNNMKTHTLFILAAVANALFTTGSAVASDPQWQVIDNHHGTYLYPARPSQTGTTVAFGGNPKKIKSMATTTKRTNENPRDAKLGFHDVTTPHGTVNYFGPVE